MRQCWECGRLVRILCNAEFFVLRAPGGRGLRSPINTGPCESGDTYCAMPNFSCCALRADGRSALPSIRDLVNRETKAGHLGIERLGFLVR